MTTPRNLLHGTRLGNTGIMYRAQIQYVHVYSFNNPRDQNP